MEHNPFDVKVTLTLAGDKTLVLAGQVFDNFDGERAHALPWPRRVFFSEARGLTDIFFGDKKKHYAKRRTDTSGRVRPALRGAGSCAAGVGVHCWRYWG